MYRPHGRYRYTGGVVCSVLTIFTLAAFSSIILQNWRALVALIVSVPPTMPGLINSINTSIPVGNATHLFDIAYIFGVRPLPLHILTFHLLY